MPPGDPTLVIIIPHPRIRMRPIDILNLVNPLEKVQQVGLKSSISFIFHSRTYRFSAFSRGSPNDIRMAFEPDQIFGLILRRKTLIHSIPVFPTAPMKVASNTV